MVAKMANKVEIKLKSLYQSKKSKVNNNFKNSR